jgi:hypothetical protein
VIPPLAYFLTWTTYGTRLHGDPRGTVDEDHNQVGRPVLAPDPVRRRRMCQKLSQAPFTLSPEAELAVQDVIRRHTEFRSWKLHAIATPRTHVHIVVDCRRPGEPMPKDPELVMEEYKSWGTRELRRRGIVGPDRRVWTDHGSTQWVNTEIGLHAAIDYVTRLQ